MGLGFAHPKPEAEPEAVGFCAKRTDTDVPKNMAKRELQRFKLVYSHVVHVVMSK